MKPDPGSQTYVHDAIVIGGGPAGSAAAHLLASWGHSVVVVQRRPATDWTLAESLPPSTLRLLDALGLGQAVEAVGGLPTTGNTVWWRDGEARSESFPDGTHGYQVLRRPFDAVLLAAAEASGATMLRDTVARAVDLDAAPAGPGPASIPTACVDCESPGGERHAVLGRFVLDCSGRAGVVARQGWRVQSRRQHTVALVGVWTCERSWGLPDESHTLVEAYADGWAWSVPISPTRRYVTMMVTPGVTELQRGAGHVGTYDAELAKTRHLRALVTRGRREGAVWSCDASLYSAARYADANALLVGDAGSFIEPLSSFGVKKALASAWLAAVATHTSLMDPSMRSTALEFFSTREQRMHAGYLAQSARFFREAAQTHPHPFWSDRFEAGGPDAPRSDGPDIDALRTDPDVLAALTALKNAPGIRLRPGPSLRVERRAGVEGRRIVFEDRVVEPSLPGAEGGVRVLRGVDLPRLIDMAPGCRQVPDLFEAYNRVCPPVSLPDFLGAVAVLVGKGMMENAAESGNPFPRCATNSATLAAIVMRFITALVTVVSLGFFALGAQAQTAPGSVDADVGIPVADERVIDACGMCHEPDADGRLTRISERRDTPEGWERTIRRMVALNGLSIQPEDARAVVKSLSNTLGLAPEEARPGAFEVERRMVDYRYEADREVEQTCTACHSLGRVINQRRTRADWALLIAMHRGFYPLVDSQVFRRPLPVNTPSSLARPPADDDDDRHPVDRVIEHLADAFPLRTAEWAAWSATRRQPRLGGTWVLSGHQSGVGDVFGRVTLAPAAHAADEFSSTISYVQARDGQAVTREGRVIVYTGFQWRGRSTASDTTWREVMFVDRDASTVSGRWFTGEHDETGIDVTLRRDVGLPTVAGLSPSAIRRSGASQAIRIHGANLDEGVSAEDLDFGPGISVARLEQADAAGITAWIDVEATAPVGARDLTLGAVVHPRALVVYDSVDSIRVLPETGLARVGGAVFPKQFQQFEAVGHADGPDGESGTADDVAIGPVDVTWSLEEYSATFEDDDVAFVGTIDQGGLFAPALDGPNPNRRDPNGSNVRNNVGDVWVVATYADAGTPGTRLRARAHLLVTVPLYMQWEPRRTP